MGLNKIQTEFTYSISKLIKYAFNQGYHLTFGDAYRDPRVFGNFGDKKAYSASKSMHKLRLAVDFNLFIDGKYITNYNEAWEDLGIYWKSLHTDARWGGDCQSKDYNHFSFTYWNCQ